MKRFIEKKAVRSAVKTGRFQCFLERSIKIFETMYKYHDPSTVLSPLDCVDAVTTIFDGGINNGAFSIAKVVWQGDSKIAIRWNVNERIKSMVQLFVLVNLIQEVLQHGLFFLTIFY
jgi:hypothetical protein